MNPARLEDESVNAHGPIDSAALALAKRKTIIHPTTLAYPIRPDSTDDELTALLEVRSGHTGAVSAQKLILVASTLRATSSASRMSSPRSFSTNSDRSQKSSLPWERPFAPTLDPSCSRSVASQPLRIDTLSCSQPFLPLLSTMSRFLCGIFFFFCVCCVRVSTRNLFKRFCPEKHWMYTGESCALFANMRRTSYSYFYCSHCSATAQSIDFATLSRRFEPARPSPS